MEKPKFKVGDHIVPSDYHIGLSHGVVIKVDDRNYYIRILRGTAILPISAQVNYKLENNE